MNDLKTAWEEFYAQVQEFMNKQDSVFEEREKILDKKLAEAKLIKSESEKLDVKRQEVEFEKDLVEKQKVALRVKQQELESQEKKIKLKQEQIQRALES